MWYGGWPVLAEGFSASTKIYDNFVKAKAGIVTKSDYKKVNIRALQ